MTSDSEGDHSVDKRQLADHVERFGIEFDDACSDRMAYGKEKYGPGKFLVADTLQEAMFELMDLANYAKLTFIRIRLLQVLLENKYNLSNQDFTQELQ
jgi:hypothetical protein